MRKKTLYIGMGLLLIATLFGLYLSQVWRSRTWHIIAEKGTVKKVENSLGHSHWVIISENGRYYDRYTVFNLPARFEKSGLGIWFLARPAGQVYIMGGFDHPFIIEVLTVKTTEASLLSLTFTSCGKIIFAGLSISLFSLLGIGSLAWSYYKHKA